MKRILGVLAFVALSGMGCGRVAMEYSPEALVAHGVPSQQSNFQKDANSEAKDKDGSISWFDSSAIHPKPRINR
ncbi:MAG: hypothetical protein EOP10_31360 [Proteobacteria bacterium]|nr:MAG: hypothetical protein EOP10_31360 [Pseudomonadota bacterium]